jgi:hypothetical protein
MPGHSTLPPGKPEEIEALRKKNFDNQKATYIFASKYLHRYGSEARCFSGDCRSHQEGDH